MPIVFINGRFVDEKNAVVSVNDHGFLYGDGVYETLRTFNGKVWQAGEHLKRMRRSAKMTGLHIPWKDSELKKWIEETVKRNGFDESRIRVTVTRGVNNYAFSTCGEPTLVIQVKKLVPEPVAAKGVKIVTIKMNRILPEAKSISLLPMILARRLADSKKAYECVFVDADGYVLEGSITNVFVVKNGVLMTPSEGVLPGTTRDFVLKLAKKRGIKTLMRKIKYGELVKADEVFVTNAPRGIVPVREVDGVEIGKRLGRAEGGFQKLELEQAVSKRALSKAERADSDGRPGARERLGAVTQTLRDEYQKYVEKY